MSLNLSPLALLAAISLPSLAAAQAAPPDLGDAQVAHVAVTANTIDVELGRLAESRAESPEVKRFAAMMRRDHTAVNEKAAALAGRLGLTPKDNPVSASLLKGAAEARARIEPLEGAAFDRAYIEREIAYHEAVLQALDDVLVPTTENAELKQLLVNVRPAFEAHLAFARQVGAKIHASR